MMMTSFYQTLILPFPKAVFLSFQQPGVFPGLESGEQKLEFELLLTSLGKGALWVSLSLCFHLCIMGKISNRETIQVLGKVR